MNPRFDIKFKSNMLIVYDEGVRIGTVEEEQAKYNLKMGYETAVKSSQKIYTKTQLWKLYKAEQVTLLNSYGITDIPRYEAGRVALLLELQG